MSLENPQQKKIDLVNTPIHRNTTEDDEDYLPPLGLGYIATAVEKSGNKVEIIDCVQEKIGVDQAIQRLNNSDAEFVGVNVFSQNLELVKEILLSLDKDKNVLIGGPASKYLQTELLSLPTKNKTIVIIGEGENIVPEIINGEIEEAPLLEDDNKKIYFIGQNSKYYSEDISDLELDRNLLIQNVLINHYGQKEVAIITSRGCPFDCAFCGGARGLNPNIKPRQKSDESVIAEILLLQKTYPDIQSIRILDDLFLKNPSTILQAIEIFKKFANLSWRSMIHATSLGSNPIIAQEMKDSGCKEVFLGIESGSKNIRDYINKTGSIELVIDSIRKLLTVGIDVKGYFIIGFPNETKEDFEKTFNLAKQIKEISLKTKGVFRTSVFKFRPYHGTKIYNDLLAQGKNILPIKPSKNLNLNKRNQFNFDAGNFSNESDETLNEYIEITQKIMKHNIKKINTVWVGISQKKDAKNLSKDSLSGSLIFDIERQIKNIKSYKTNLVDFAPTDKTGKLCYPTKIEIDQNFNSLWNNIIYKKSKIIFLLGGMVVSAFENNLKIKITKWNNYNYFVTRFNELTIIAVQHPSYIRVYKKKDTEKYIQNIVNVFLRS